MGVYTRLWTAAPLLLLAGPAALGAATAPLPAGTAAYRILDNVEGDFIDLALVPVRPMAVTADAQHLYAVNTHGSTVVHYDTSLTLQQTFRVPWGPVSIALLDGAAGPELLVVSRGNHVLTRLDRATGQVRGVLILPSEPADLLVEPGGARAWVSCGGADVVVEVDLALWKISRTIPIPSKQPTFLAWDGADVLVAPQLSGNNTAVDDGGLLLAAGEEGIIDLSQAPLGLPDEDLFRIDTATGAVEAVSRGAGAVLFAHGIHPVTGEHWQLATEAHNAGPFGEPLLRGRFVDNRITLSALPMPGGGATVDHLIVDLDGDDGPDVAPAPTGPVVDAGLEAPLAQPGALAFSSRGDTFVAGILSHNVAWLDADGRALGQLGVCEIPRGLSVVDVEGHPTFLLVYCWGSNEVEVWNLVPPEPALLASLDLGWDPTPPEARAGRAIFYDATHSERGNASCASCHVDGATDMLAWVLGDAPVDDKGPLVTQTLRGIEPLRPYHWRGERGDLADFNGAFDALLGAPPLGEADRLAFEAYVFGLQNPANPRQDPRRLVNGALDEIGGLPGVDPDAVRGQDLFFDQVVAAGFTCEGCHALPLGTSNDIFNDEPGHTLEPGRSHFKVAPFHALWRKEQPTRVTIDDGSGPRVVPTLGGAVSAAGLTDSLLDFVSLPAFALDDQGRADITAFVHQHDAGLAPRVHHAWHLKKASAAALRGVLGAELLAQAEARWVDIVAFGKVTLAAGPGPSSWAYSRVDGRFHADTASAPSLSMGDLLTLASRGKADVVVAALPVGMGARFAVDADNDGLLNTDEALAHTHPQVEDTDGDGAWDGPEVQAATDPLDPASTPTDTAPPAVEALRLVYTTARVAKLSFDTSEPARFHVRAVDTAGEVVEAHSTRPTTTHTALLRHLLPGRTYTATVTAEDVAGNTHTVALPGPVTTRGLLTPTDVVVSALHVSDLEAGPGTLTFVVEAQVSFKAGGPAPGLHLALEAWRGAEDLGFFYNSTPSDADGLTSLVVHLTGLFPGDEVRLPVWSLYTVDPTLGPITTLWSLPETPADLREVSVVY